MRRFDIVCGAETNDNRPDKRRARDAEADSSIEDLEMWPSRGTGGSELRDRRRLALEMHCARRTVHAGRRSDVLI
jgi:hypothetical protein